MIEAPPLVVILAGPNGAGESTTASQVLRGGLAVEEFVNADTLAVGLSAFRPESVAIAAGRMMLTRVHELAERRADFAFETTLSGRSYAPWLRDLRASGYRVHMTFLALPDAETAVARVAERVRRGGHGIPTDTIRRRYVAGLRNFHDLYRWIATSWQLLDNGESRGPSLIAELVPGGSVTIVDPVAWARTELAR